MTIPERTDSERGAGFWWTACPTCKESVAYGYGHVCALKSAAPSVQAETPHQHTDACYSKVPETEGKGEYLSCGKVAGQPASPDARHVNLDSIESICQDIFRLAMGRPPKVNNSMDDVVLDAWRRRLNHLSKAQRQAGEQASSEMNWYCYVCGEPLGERFCLWSLSDSTDRVFLCHEKCKERLMDAIVVSVERAAKQGEEGGK